jgi:hypothetical protein
MSGIDCLPPAPIRVGLINEAQLRHGFVSLGNTDPDPLGHKAGHMPAISAP